MDKINIIENLSNLEVEINLLRDFDDTLELNNLHLAISEYLTSINPER